MTPEENTLNLQEIRDRMATQRKINKLLAYDPTTEVWQRTLAESTTEELQQAYNQCRDKTAWGSVALKNAIDSRQSEGTVS